MATKSKLKITPLEDRVVVSPDEETETMRVLSLIGAVAPVGSAPPNVVFRLPD